MSDNLRADLVAAFAESYYVGGTTASRTQLTESRFGKHLDALLPVIREHLAQAWDDGVWHCGSAHHNPWREDD